MAAKLELGELPPLDELFLFLINTTATTMAAAIKAMVTKHHIQLHSLDFLYATPISTYFSEPGYLAPLSILNEITLSYDVSRSPRILGDGHRGISCRKTFTKKHTLSVSKQKIDIAAAPKSLVTVLEKLKNFYPNLSLSFLLNAARAK